MRRLLLPAGLVAAGIAASALSGVKDGREISALALPAIEPLAEATLPRARQDIATVGRILPPQQRDPDVSEAITALGSRIEAEPFHLAGRFPLPDLLHAAEERRENWGLYFLANSAKKTINEISRGIEAGLLMTVEMPIAGLLEQVPFPADASAAVADTMLVAGGTVEAELWPVFLPSVLEDPADGTDEDGSGGPVLVMLADADDQVDARMSGVPALGEVSAAIAHHASVPSLTAYAAHEPVHAEVERIEGNLAARGWRAVLSGGTVFLEHREDPASRVPVQTGMVLGHLGKVRSILISRDVSEVAVVTDLGGTISGPGPGEKP